MGLFLNATLGFARMSWEKHEKIGQLDNFDFWHLVTIMYFSRCVMPSNFDFSYPVAYCVLYQMCNTVHTT
jgi:hypothetical protein